MSLSIPGNDTGNNENVCENCGSYCGTISRNGMCSICYDNSNAMDDIANIDAIEFAQESQDNEDEEDGLDGGYDNEPSQVSQIMEVSADGSVYVPMDEFSVEKFFESTYRCDIVDPVSEFCNNLKINERETGNGRVNVEKKESLNSNLWQLLCCIEYSDKEDGLVSKGSMARDNQWTNLVTRFEQLIDSLPSQSYYQEGLFAHLPGGTFPESFVGYVNSFRNKAPTQTWLSRNHINFGNTTEQTRKSLYFGDSILNAAKGAGQEVKNLMNVHWKDQFASGFNATGKHLLLT